MAAAVRWTSGCERNFSLKLIQLNIWQGKILIAVSRFLQEQNADIVCMQEVFSSKEKAVFPLLDMLNSLETLQKELNYPYCYFEPTCEFDVSGSSAQFGNAILSKFPLINTRPVFTNGAFTKIQNWHVEYASNVRNALLCEVETPSGRFTLVNHHGYHEMDRTGSEATVVAMKKLTDELHTINGPMLMSGDLNIVAESAAMRLFDGWLDDLTDTHHIDDTLSVFGKVSQVPCDHILVSSEIKVKDFSVNEQLISDHKALILEFDL